MTRPIMKLMNFVLPMRYTLFLPRSTNGAFIFSALATLRVTLAHLREVHQLAIYAGNNGAHPAVQLSQARKCYSDVASVVIYDHRI